MSMSNNNNDSQYFTPKQKQRTKCPECGQELKPFAFGVIFTSTNMGGQFWACGNPCEYLELRE